MENREIIKTLKIKKILGCMHALYGEEFAADPNYEYGRGEFLFDLFYVISDAGLYVEEDLKNNEDCFSGNVTYAKIKENNMVTFGSYYDDLEQQMELREFLRVNKEYYRLENSNIDEIIFKRVDKKITVEAVSSNTKRESLIERVKKIFSF